MTRIAFRITKSLPPAKTHQARYGSAPMAAGWTASIARPGRFFAYRHDPKNPASLSSDAVLSLLIDHQGTLWVGTQGGGLDRFDSRTGRFTSYLNQSLDPVRFVPGPV